MRTKEKSLHTLIPIDDFKAMLGVDDREEKTARFCLVTATLSIEQYCKRKLLRKKHIENIEFFGDLILPLNEYPVISINNEQLKMSNGEILGKNYFRVIPDCGTEVDLPCAIELTVPPSRLRGVRWFRVAYKAGYAPNNVPADLSAACMELAAWNMNRYRGRRIGMTGNIRGSGRDGEHFEMSMPENVRQLLEPYRRKTI
jgi:hypothetical protein